MRRSDWLGGLVVGAAAGVLFWIFPTLAVVILVLFALPVMTRRAPLVALFGAFLGAGASSLLVLGQSILRCAQFDAAPNQECVQPDLAPWVVAAALVLATGIAGSVIASVSGRPPEAPPTR
jgi:hypothetical protein